MINQKLCLAEGKIKRRENTQNYAPRGRLAKLNHSYTVDSQEDLQDELDDPMLKGTNYVLIKQKRFINTEESNISFEIFC